jgi:2-(1,2-epoxy-1,2-dihydrophenyl)acetyl-CoA isomerase
MSDPTVLYEVAERVATITLNRPDRLNAFDREMIGLLADRIAEADADTGVGCIVITGAGRGFCSGGDVNMVHAQDEAEASLDGQIAWRMGLHESVPLRLYETRTPTIAGVNGVAAGAGMAIACACDLRVASSGARFSAAYGRIGRSGDFGGTWFLTRLVGPSRAREMYLTGRPVDAERALSLGLVDDVHAPDALAAEVRALASDIAAGPPSAQARMKDAFRLAEVSDLRQVLRLEATNQTLCGASPEGRDYLERFMQKRSEPR